MWVAGGYGESPSQLGCYAQSVYPFFLSRFVCFFSLAVIAGCFFFSLVPLSLELPISFSSANRPLSIRPVPPVYVESRRTSEMPLAFGRMAPDDAQGRAVAG